MAILKRLAVLFAVLCWPLSAIAADAACYRAAAQQFALDERLLYAIAGVESAHNALALNINANQTADIGLMQINSVHLAELAGYGISISDLFDPCTNLMVGAFLLKRHQLTTGDIWQAVRHYHSRTPALGAKYLQRVQRQLAQ
ncbi:lytic transglycosylase domain-containing protein [Serratia quinivorans]|uniref:lytic transglycosylase domain-containing protein n=1 Tax=Serratia quinivorans TaxID=137545 RepID=UPI00217C0417|nr:lytic transglycosylase domain-containing protein [Serratia quinivorans]CAI1006657.1 invasion protein IagB [Serratia quinivorans]CAI1807258.1 invasion protein IagB [Serratia quinivorans]